MQASRDASARCSCLRSLLALCLPRRTMLGQRTFIQMPTESESPSSLAVSVMSTVWHVNMWCVDAHPALCCRHAHRYKKGSRLEPVAFQDSSLQPSWHAETSDPSSAPILNVQYAKNDTSTCRPYLRSRCERSSKH